MIDSKLGAKREHRNNNPFTSKSLKTKMIEAGKEKGRNSNICGFVGYSM